MTTPTKIDLINSTLSPVRFSASPIGKSPKVDLSSVNHRILFIVRKLISDHEKWESEQRIGFMICSSIDKIKTKVFEPSVQTLNPFPDELYPLCEKLNNVIKSFKDIINYSYESKKQLEALHKLNKNKDDILFKTWTSADFIKAIKEIINLYEEEYKIKILVNDNIAHSKTKGDLILHLAVWEDPCFVGTEAHLLFKILAKECL